LIIKSLVSNVPKLKTNYYR